jgi:hypothetical protein
MQPHRVCPSTLRWLISCSLDDMRASRALPLIGVLLAACATEAPLLQEPVVTLSQKEVVDIYEAALRYRMAKFPLPRGSKCDVFIQTGAIPALAKRFPEYDMVVRVGSVGSPGRPPPPVRWYDLDIRPPHHDHVFVNEMDARNEGVFLELRRKDGHWTVVDERPFVII